MSERGDAHYEKYKPTARLTFNFLTTTTRRGEAHAATAILQDDDDDNDVMERWTTSIGRCCSCSCAKVIVKIENETVERVLFRTDGQDGMPTIQTDNNEALLFLCPVIRSV